MGTQLDFTLHMLCSSDALAQLRRSISLYFLSSAFIRFAIKHSSSSSTSFRTKIIPNIYFSVSNLSFRSLRTKLLYTIRKPSSRSIQRGYLLSTSSHPLRTFSNPTEFRGSLQHSPLFRTPQRVRFRKKTFMSSLPELRNS